MVAFMSFAMGQFTEDALSAVLIGQRRRCCDHDAHGAWDLSRPMLAYFAAAHKQFYLYRKMLMEMSGLLLLDTLGAGRDHHAVAIECQLAENLAEAADQNHAAPPAAAAHLHHHMNEAARCLNEAHRYLRNKILLGRNVTFAHAALQSASQHLRLAADLLPGADMVDRSEACCFVNPR